MAHRGVTEGVVSTLLCNGTCSLGAVPAMNVAVPAMPSCTCIARAQCLSREQATHYPALQHRQQELSAPASMKFGALLRGSAEGTPELQSLFQCYKHLKKRLKRLPERPNADHPPDAAPISEDEMAQRQRNFVMTLNDDVNQVWMEVLRSKRVIIKDDIEG